MKKNEGARTKEGLYYNAGIPYWPLDLSSNYNFFFFFFVVVFEFQSNDQFGILDTVFVVIFEF